MLENPQSHDFTLTYIKALVEDLLPETSINDERASHALIGKTSKKEFQKYIDVEGIGDPESLVLSFISVNKESKATKYVVIINNDGIGDNPDQEPKINLPYAILHELVEMEIIQPSEEITHIAEIISQNQIFKGITDEMESRQSKPHLQAVVAEFIAALNNIDGSPTEKRDEALRLLETSTKPIREKDYQYNLDDQIRIAVVKEIFRIKDLPPITHYTY